MKFDSSEKFKTINLTPKQYLKIYRSKKYLIKSATLTPPILGSNNFGYYKVVTKTFLGFFQIKEILKGI